MSKVEMGGNLQQDISSAEQEKQEPGLELVRGEELDGVVEVSNDLAGKMERDEKIIGDDVLKLDEALGKVKINIGGDIMTVEEAIKIPDLKKNMEIWERIKSGVSLSFVEIQGMTFITSKILSILLEDAMMFTLNHNVGNIDLHGLKEITIELARTIINKSIEDVSINLDGVQCISDEVAEILLCDNRYSQISLRGIKDVSDRTLAMIAKTLNERRDAPLFSDKIFNRALEYLEEK